MYNLSMSTLSTSGKDALLSKHRILEGERIVTTDGQEPTSSLMSLYSHYDISNITIYARDVTN